MSSKKKQVWKEPAYFKPGDMYYFDKGTNARINQLLKADKDRTKPKVPPAYSLPNKILENSLFKPLFSYYIGFGLEDVPPPPYGSAPADPFEVIEPGQNPPESVKQKGQDIKRNMAYLQKKLDEATAKRMAYYEQLTAALAKAKKLEKKSNPVSKVSNELETCKETVRTQDTTAKKSVFNFGDMTFPVMRMVIVIDGSAGSKTSLAEIKEEIIQFIENEVTEHDIALGIVYLGAKDEPQAFKNHLVKDWNEETKNALKKWLKNVKTISTPAGQPKLLAGIKFCLDELQPTVITLATSHGALNDENETELVLQELAVRCPPSFARPAVDHGSEDYDDEDDEDDESLLAELERQEEEERLAADGVQRAPTVAEPSAATVDAEAASITAPGQDATPVVAAPSVPSPTDLAVMERMGVDIRVLRLECKLTSENAEAEDRNIDLHLMKLIEVALGEQASEEDVELGYSKMSRSALWKAAVATVKKTTKLRKKKASLSTIAGDAEANNMSINPLRLNLHGQLAVERVLQFDIARCQACMAQPVVTPPPPVEKAGKKSRSPSPVKKATSKKAESAAGAGSVPGSAGPGIPEADDSLNSPQ